MQPVPHYQGWQYLLIHRDTLVLLRREGGIRVYIVRDLLISRTPVRSALSAVKYRRTYRWLLSTGEMHHDRHC
jgi:hypothetical protein